MEGEPIAQIAHDVISIGGEPDVNGYAPVSENPHRNRKFGAGSTRAPDLIDSRKWAQCISDIV